MRIRYNQKILTLSAYRPYMPNDITIVYDHQLGSTFSDYNNDS